MNNLQQQRDNVASADVENGMLEVRESNANTGEKVDRAGGYGGNDDEEMQLEKAKHASQIEPRPEDMKAAAELVIAADEVTPSDTNSTSKIEHLKNKGKQEDSSSSLKHIPWINSCEMEQLPAEGSTDITASAALRNVDMAIVDKNTDGSFATDWRYMKQQLQQQESQENAIKKSPSRPREDEVGDSVTGNDVYVNEEIVEVSRVGRSPTIRPGAVAIPGIFGDMGLNDSLSDDQVISHTPVPTLQVDSSEEEPIVATLVEESQPIQDSPTPLVLATEDKRRINLQDRQVRIWLVVIVILIGALAVALGVSLSNKSSKSNPSPSTGGDPTPAPDSDTTLPPAVEFCDDSMCWRQVGLDLESAQHNNEFGSSVSLSADGSRILVSAPLDSSGQGQAGLIQVFDIFEDGSMAQVGSDVLGESRNEQIRGILSEDGLRIAVSAPGSNNGTGKAQVLELQSNEWVILGQPVYGTQQGEDFGDSVALSFDGNVLAVGAWYHHGEAGERSGAMYVYEYNGSAWEPLGNVLEGSSDEHFGMNVALSDDGRSVACGTYSSDFTGKTAGSVRIYDYHTPSKNWVLKGTRVDGKGTYDYFGDSFALDSTADHFAASAGGGTPQVRTYSFDQEITGDWEQIGESLNTSDTYDAVIGVMMSFNGMRLAAGRQFGGGTLCYVFVYDFVEGSWQQVGADVRVARFSEPFYTGMSLSSDGSRLAVGGTRDDSTGHVQVFELVPL